MLEPYADWSFHPLGIAIQCMKKVMALRDIGVSKMILGLALAVGNGKKLTLSLECSDW